MPKNSNKEFDLWVKLYIEHLISWSKTFEHLNQLIVEIHSATYLNNVKVAAWKILEER